MNSQRHSLTLLSSALIMILVAACPAGEATSEAKDSAGQTDKHEDPQEAATAERPQDTRSLKERFGELKPELGAGAAAQAIFLEAHKGGGGDEAQLVADLTSLLACLERVAVAHAQELLNAEHEGAIRDVMLVRFEGETPDDVKPEDLATGDKLIADGVTLLNEGEGAYSATLHWTNLASTLKPALPKTSLMFLEVEGLEQDKVESAFDEPGFGGDPNDVADVLVRWEALAALGSAGASKRMDAVAETYLKLCVSHFEDVHCTVGPDLVKSYEIFVEAHSESVYQPCVRIFLEGVKKSRLKLTQAKIKKLIEASLAAKR